MASGDTMARVKQTLTQYKERSETADVLKLTPFMKCIEACGLKQYKTTIEASIWSLFKDKANKVPIDKVATDVIDELAADVIAKKRKQTRGRAPVDDPEVQALANEIRAKIAAKAGAAVVKAGKVDSTTARLTDVSGYTGSHKERFDAGGKGKGIDGRVNRVENTGYVGNYKGDGTFDKKGGASGKTPSKADSITARLTDASGYTGSHKERFDAGGRGKGIGGRVDRVEQSGYVGNYKGEGTYGKK